MPETPPAYRALTATVVALLPLARRLAPKLAHGDRERRAAVARWEAWARASRDRRRPLLWCHAPSVGEGLQAEVVLQILRDRHPEWQLVYSFFSPSAEALARRIPADHADYLPYDRPRAAERLLQALAPTALVFTKLDLWPELATRAAGRGVRVGLVAATVSPVSGRLRWPARGLARSGYAAVDRAGAVAPADADRLASLGTPADRIAVTGDPRSDSALARARAAPDDDPLLRLGRPAPTLVAGSTWPADDRAVLPAFHTVLGALPGARLILVPHEPTAAHLRAVREKAAQLGLPEPVPLSAAQEPAPFVVADRVGVLATLYRTATLAYVGGGFGRSGLHSVLEPAACGVPVLFGPAWQSSREAGLLLEAGGALALPRDGAPEALTARWLLWCRNEEARAEAGRAALAVVNEGRGGAERNAALVEALMAG